MYFRGEMFRHWTRCLLIVLCIIGSFHEGISQTPGKSIISGSITDTHGAFLSGATVTIKELNRSAVSNDEGFFKIEEVPDGSFNLHVSFIGYKIHEEVVVVDAKNKWLDIQLEKTEDLLTGVTITYGLNKFNKKETDDVARLPLKNIENPQVYSVITKEIMAEQIVTDYNSIFKNIPGAGVPIVYNQGRSAMLARGFVTANLIRNSISGFVYTNIDPANLEVLEAIKGPSGTLFNSSQISFGGLFNRVTKKPFAANKGEVSYTGGSYNLNRITFDINRKLNDDASVLMRLNGALHTEQSFQDFGFTRSAMLAPSFIYKVNDRLTFLLDIEASLYNATSPVRFAPSTQWTVHNIEDLAIGYKRSFSNNTLDYKTQQVNSFGQILYKLSNQWKLQTNITRTYSATKGYVSMLTGTGSHNDSLRLSVQKENFPYNGTEIQQNIIGDFQIGSLRNRLVAGVDYYNQRSDRSTPNVVFSPINFTNPGKVYNNFTADKVDSMSVNPQRNDVYRTNQSTYSVYVSDVLNITRQLNVMLSLRADRFEDDGRYTADYDTASGAFAQNALSPKLGIVYEVLKDKLSFFGNYMNGFNNQGGTDFFGNTFKPQQANQWELGMKADLFEHRLSSTISYYDISVKNTLITDLEHNGYSVQDGTQISRGMEVEVIANPFGGFNIVAGYAYNNSKLTKTNETQREGLRPAEAGPEHLANLWLSYRVIRGKIKGLGMGFGGNYGSSAFQTNTKNFVFTIPAYTVLDATVYYDAARFRVGVKVDNLSNEKYWSFRLAPQLPRRLSANVAFRF